MNENEARAIAKLREKFGEVKPASNGWVRIACPTCVPKDRKKFKRYVRPDTLYNKCFICEMPMQRDELVGESFIQVSNPANISVDEPKKEHPMAKKLPGLRFTPVNQLPVEHPAIKFLHRDYLFEMDRYYNEYGIVYCPCDAGVTFNSRPFISSAERLIFPVKFRGELVGWQMRSIPGTVYGDRPDVVKYYHLFNKGSVLFNYDKAKSFQTVVLMEGVKKALKLPNAVACFGKDVTSTQVQLLAEWPNVIVCLDSQDVAQAIGQRITDSLRGFGRKAINVNLGPYGFPSPDEMTSDQLSFVLFNEWKSVYGTHTV
jgi:hypothetical protein